jgi:hypothetical protein
VCPCEPTVCVDSGQLAMRRLHELLGVPFSDVKHVIAEESNIFLGVVSDFSELPSEGMVSMRVCPERRERLIETLQDAINSQILEPREAESLDGKLLFVMLSVYGVVGRAALAALRSHARGVSSEVTPSLMVALEFLHDFMYESPVFRVPALPPVECPVLVWSDAMFTRGDKRLAIPEAGCEAGLGFVVYSPYTGAFVHAEEQMPPSTLARLFKPHEQYIGILECWAAAAVATSVPELLRDRLVIHFIDNQGSLHNMLTAKSRDFDSARIVHGAASALMRLNARVWYEYVPSDANIADLPSRSEWSFVERLASKRVPFVAPTLTYVPMRPKLTSA